MRGFTLLELMVVVIIITIVSTLAMRSVVNRLRSNRTRQASENGAMLFRQARLRAVGRTSAMLIRYNAGTFELREAIQGTPNAPAAGCERLPETSCTLPSTRWDDGLRSQRIEYVDYVGSGDLTVSATDGSGTQTTLDFCFAPSGRAFVRTTPTGAFTPWVSPVRFDFDRTDGVGFQRTVLLSPAGTSRVVASP